MSKRHRDALAIQEGACNPSGIALSIAAACREIRDDPYHTGTTQLTSDPAIKLMVHQLAFICGVIGTVDDMYSDPKYSECTKACKEADEKVMT